MFDQNASILLVEDDRVDVMTVQRALKKNGATNPLYVARTGLEALEMLRGEGLPKIDPPPALILLDLNLPKKDGRELIEEIKADENLRRIPVVVLTTSKAEEDIIRMYDQHANCYITKPIDFDQFINVIKSIEDFWLTIVKLPTD